MQFRTAGAFLALIAGLAAAATPAQARPQLNEQEIRKTVAGKRIYLKVPLGGEFPLHYRTDGQVNGSGDAVGLGRFMQPKDQGRWWVRGNRLCQKWESWYDGKQFCFTLSKGEGDTLYWQRDDGMSGRARIGR
ncbi:MULTISPECIES: hypothetical protein [unclassified Stappia]|uniref:hypothetical protein n=1 Tax=unclassified Stappia TaxID=2629676 RepID=UPI001643A15D|nr:MULTISPECIES: hypothetical protein [unclassified Stappia]